MTKGAQETLKSKLVPGDTQAVDAFMAALDHPLKTEIEVIRGIIRGAGKGITEHIKWNAPSFVFKDDFATLKLRPQTAIQVVFHTGAKPKGKKIDTDDPDGLLKWVASDRAFATFANMTQITSKQAALAAIVQQWIEQM
jgi:hypothetical protein